MEKKRQEHQAAVRITPTARKRGRNAAAQPEPPAPGMVLPTDRAGLSSTAALCWPHPEGFSEPVL